MMRCLILFLAFCLPISAQAQSAAPPPPQPTAFSFPNNAAPKAGRVYGQAATSVPTSQAVSAANRLWVSWVYVPGNGTLKTLSFDIGTGNASAWNARMCVYADNGGTPASAALVADGGTVAIGSGSVTGIQTATLSGNGVQLGGPAYYWVGFMADSSAESLFALANGNAYLGSVTTNGFSSIANLFQNSTSQGWYMAQSFGSCPSTFSASPTDSSGQVVPYVAMGY